jgi:carbamoyltransferase
LNIIGLHRGHNSAVALVQNGSLIFSLQEERLTRVKNQGGVPRLALTEIAKLNSFGANGHETHVAYAGRALTTVVWQRNGSGSGYGRASLINRLKSTARKSETLGEIIDVRKAGKVAQEVGGVLGLPSLELNRIEHHLCHASAAYFGWGKMDKQILIITCDGAGDGICASVNIGYKGKIKRIGQVEQGHSIGRLYSIVTYLLGMVPLEHEYKIMGLAPYAENSKESMNIADQLETFFAFDPKNPIVWHRDGSHPIQHAVEFFANFFRHKRFDHVAGGLQLFLERFLCRWVRNCILETGVTSVALSGGVFMNVKANQKILQIPELEELFIFPSCGDETNAIGAAWFLYHQLSDSPPTPLSHLYLGSQFTNTDVDSALRTYRFQNKVRIEQLQNIEEHIAELLAKEEIVARFQGKMEFGARALGNRSILANPSNPKSVRIINEMIKCRDFWMPFAPSVLADRTHDYFITPKSMTAPYMIITFNTREDKRHKIAAVIHPYDYTARPQEIYEDWNPRYYALLKHFESITGEGIILNTSFNLHGEPVVCSPEDALRVYDISGLKFLAIENFLLTKN